MRAHKRQTWDITAQFLKQANGFRWGAKGWQVVVRGLATEEEKAEERERERETLPIRKSIVQFQHLSEDILGSGWISAEIRIGKVFFPSSPAKALNLSRSISTPVTVLIDFKGEGCVRCTRFTPAPHCLCSISAVFTQFRPNNKVGRTLTLQLTSWLYMDCEPYLMKMNFST